MTFDLQDLVEKVVTLRKAIELKLGYSPEISSPVLAGKLSEYAHLLASQGNLQTAMNYLGQSQEVYHSFISSPFSLGFQIMAVFSEMYNQCLHAISRNYLDKLVS